MKAKRGKHDSKGNEHYWRRAALLGILCAALGALVLSDDLHEGLLALARTLEAVIQMQPALGAILFVFFAAISAMLAFVSVAAIVPVAILAWGTPITLALLWSGWMLGGLLAYSLGRWLGRPVVVWLSANSPVFRRVERFIRRDTPFGLVLLFQLALPSEIPGYVLGLVRYRPLRFLLSLAIAEIPYAFATVYLSESVLQRRGIGTAMFGIALIALSVGTFYLLNRRLNRQVGPTEPFGPSP